MYNMYFGCIPQTGTETHYWVHGLAAWTSILNTKNISISFDTVYQRVHSEKCEINMR